MCMYLCRSNEYAHMRSWGKPLGRGKRPYEVGVGKGGRMDLRLGAVMREETDIAVAFI